MFVYEVTTTDGYVVRVTTAGDPTDHPSLWGRVGRGRAAPCLTQLQKRC